MNRIRFATVGAAVAMLGIAGVCAAQQAGTMNKNTTTDDIKPLKIGDPARDIDITHWIKPGELKTDGGFEPITTFEDNKIYVLEFWATWCGPCVASMPHLTELQEKYADYDVTFIGVSDEPLPTVVSFLFKEYKPDKKVHNDRIGYTLTTDPDRSVYNDYFKAAGQTGIPCAFIIGKDTRVEWIGHPMNMDKPLEQIVHDNWNRQAYIKQMEKQDKLQEHLRAGNHAEALELIDELLKDDSENLGLQWQKFLVLLVHMDQPKQAYTLGNTMVRQNWDNAQFLNQFAWFIVDSPDVETRDLDLAMKAANRANELTNEEDAAILDTVARVYYEKGDMRNALKWQRKAVELAGDDMMGQQLRETLKRYESDR